MQQTLEGQVGQGVGDGWSRGKGVRGTELTLVFLRTEDQAHVAVLNEEGDGLTTPAADGHIHRIRELEIEPAEDGHVHQLGAERAPRPADYRRYRQLLEPRRSRTPR